MLKIQQLEIIGSEGILSIVFPAVLDGSGKSIVAAGENSQQLAAGHGVPRVGCKK